MFTRSMAVRLSGMSEEQIKNFGRSDTPPAFMRAGSELQANRWNRYSARDVVLIAVTERLRMQIGYAEGLRPGTAGDIADYAAREALEDALTSETPIWAGYVGQPEDFEDRGKGEHKLGGFNVNGSLQAITNRVNAINDVRPVRLFLVNVSAVLDEVRRRAAFSGFDLDFSEPQE